MTKRPSNTAEPHLGLAYVAAVLQKDNFTVRFVDGDALGLSLAAAADAAVQGGPLLVGLTAPTALIKSAAQVADAIKKRDPQTIVAIGGYHATALPEETLREFPAFDVAVFGEGEDTAVELARATRDGAAFADIAGVCWRDGPEIRRNEPRPRIRDLNALPMPAWELFPLDRYCAHYRTDRAVRELPLNIGRGCVGRCTFCARVSGPVLRRRSAEGVLAEIGQDMERYGAGAVVFMDESFAQDRELAAAICEGLLARNWSRKIYWLCQTRVDSVDRELLGLMARAGCRHVSFGVESGAPEILGAANKGVDKAMIREAVRNAKEAGILVDNFFILGLPGETTATVRQTIDFAVELDSAFVNFFILTPYPGSEIFAAAGRGEQGLRLLTRDWDFYGIQMGRALELEGLPRSRLERLQFLAYLRFYLRPRKVRYMLRMLSWKVLPVYLWNLLRSWLAQRFAIGER